MAELIPFTERLLQTFSALTEEQQNTLTDYADSSCTNGFDNDGSTGHEIFCNGFQLARKAGNRPVYTVKLEGVWHEAEANSSLFFIGTEEEVEQTLQRVAQENPSE